MWSNMEQFGAFQMTEKSWPLKKYNAYYDNFMKNTHPSLFDKYNKT